MTVKLQIDTQQAEWLSEQFQVERPSVYRVSLPGADGRFYVTFVDHQELGIKVPILLTSATTTIEDGYPDKHKMKMLSDWRTSMYLKGKNPDIHTRRRQDYGTVMHVLDSDIAQGKSIPLANYNGDEPSLENYIRSKNLKLSEDSFNYVFNEAIDELRKDLMAFKKWMVDYNVRPLAIELMSCLPKYNVGSAIDLICLIDVDVEDYYREVYKTDTKNNKKGDPKLSKQKEIHLVIVDLKSGKSGFYDTHVLQLLLYKEMIEETYGIKVQGVYNFAPKDWRTSPDYSFVKQDTKKVSKYFDAVMTTGMMKFEDKPKTYKVFEGSLSLENGTESYKEYNVLHELYKMYCPNHADRLISELNGEKYVVEESIVEEITNIEIIAESITTNKTYKFFPPNTFIERDNVVMLFRESDGGIAMTDCAYNKGRMYVTAIGLMDIHGLSESFHIASEDNVKAFLKELEDHDIALDDQFVLRRKSIGHKLTRNEFWPADFKKFNCNTEEVQSNLNEMNEEERIKSITDIITVVKEDIEQDQQSEEPLGEFKDNDILIRSTDFFTQMVRYKGCNENNAVLTDMTVSTAVPVKQFSSPIVGVGYVSDYRLATEDEIQLMNKAFDEANKLKIEDKPIVEDTIPLNETEMDVEDTVEDDISEQVAYQEFYEEMAAKNPFDINEIKRSDPTLFSGEEVGIFKSFENLINSSEDIHRTGNYAFTVEDNNWMMYVHTGGYWKEVEIEVEQEEQSEPSEYDQLSVDYLITELRKKETPRSRAVLLGKQSEVDISNLYYYIFGKELDLRIPRRRVLDELKEVDYYGAGINDRKQTENQEENNCIHSQIPTETT